MRELMESYKAAKTHAEAEDLFEAMMQNLVAELAETGSDVDEDGNEVDFVSGVEAMLRENGIDVRRGPACFE